MAYDPEFQKAQDRTFERLGFPPNRPTPRFDRGDIASRRTGLRAFSKAFFALDPDDFVDIETKEYMIPGYEQAQITLTAYRKKDQKSPGPEPAVYYMHGGGMITGEGELYSPMIKADVRATGVPHFSIDYRLAPEYPHPAPVEDCYAGLLWLSTHAQELGIDPARIGVVGLSAGGGLAAGVALLARDRGLSPPLAKQILFCPMLDDRNIETDSASLPLMTWSWDDNWTGWNALLGQTAGTDSVSEYAAPARAKQLHGLPTTYIDVGSKDIFAKEDQEYAERLRAANVMVEFNLYDSVPHGFELRGIGSKVYERAIANRQAAVRGL